MSISSCHRVLGFAAHPAAAPSSVHLTHFYGCIDAYSRNIIWLYVGISNCTAQSVLQQYLTTCSTLGFQPQIVQSDHGKETLLCAEVHFALACMTQDDPNFKFGDCWFYGTSTGNQRIESWWAQLEKSQLYHWRVSYIT